MFSSLNPQTARFHKIVSILAVLFYLFLMCLRGSNLLPHSETEPWSSAVKAWSPNHWATREFHDIVLIYAAKAPGSGNHCVYGIKVFLCFVRNFDVALFVTSENYMLTAMLFMIFGTSLHTPILISICSCHIPGILQLGKHLATNLPFRICASKLVFHYHLLLLLRYLL